MTGGMPGMVDPTPQIPRHAQRRPAPRCVRGHDIAGYNSYVRGFRAPVCRACYYAKQWACRANLLYDDPKVLAHADELYAKYREKTP